MHGNIRIPPYATKYILFQRTQHLKITNSLPLRIWRKFFPFNYKAFVALEGKLRSRTIHQAYIEEMRTEYESILDYLPSSCNSVLDIGCGLATIDVFLDGHYRDSDLEFYLLDKSQTDENVYYRFESKGSFYNSLKLASSLLQLNGIQSQRIHCIEAREYACIPTAQKVDLALSLISWGFHYPVSTYLSEVCKVLASDGALIMDIRKNTDGMEQIQSAFTCVDIIFERPKYWRICARALCE